MIGIFVAISQNKEKEPSIDFDIMYFNSMQELSEWSEKLMKENVEIKYIGSTMYVLDEYKNFVNEKEVYCIIYIIKF